MHLGLNDGTFRTWVKGNEGMRVVLRHAGMGLFYAGPKHWVGQSDAALDLKTVERATEVSREEAFEQMEVHVSFDEPDCDLVLPLKHRTTVVRPP